MDLKRGERRRSPPRAVDPLEFRRRSWICASNTLAGITMARSSSNGSSYIHLPSVFARRDRFLGCKCASRSYGVTQFLLSGRR